MYYNIDTELLNNIRSEVINIAPDLKPEEKLKRNIIVNRVSVEKYLNLKYLKCFMQQLDLLDHVLFMSFNTTIKAQSPIHIDSTEFKYSLNIPIKNYSGTYCCFYQTKGIKTMSTINFGAESVKKESSNYYTFDEKNCTLIAKYETVQPAIIDTTVPHRFYNLKMSERQMLLIRLKNSANKVIDKITNSI